METKEQKIKELEKKIRFESELLAVLSLQGVPNGLIASVENIRCKDIQQLKELEKGNEKTNN